MVCRAELLYKALTDALMTGELELWVNGKSVIHATGVVIRAVNTTRVRGIEAETFFGGEL